MFEELTEALGYHDSILSYSIQNSIQSGKTPAEIYSFIFDVSRDNYSVMEEMIGSELLRRIILFHEYTCQN